MEEKKKNNYCQLVVGPPGAGKTTYCKNMVSFLLSIKKFPVFINLDPGNENEPLAKINICDLIFSREISSELHLGPNGSILFSMEIFEKNLDWFEKKIKKILKFSFPVFFLIDLPGQIEIFTHHSSIRKLISRIKKEKISLISVIISDSLYWKDKSIVYSVLVMCLSILLNLELSHINLLSKTDLIFFDPIGLDIFQKPQNIFFQLNFSLGSIFYWANKFNNCLDEFIFDFSSLTTLAVNLFNIEHIRKIFFNIFKNLNRF